ncbi:MAG TPA: hypothetical protein PLR06_10565, partial [Cyclobacteriaceae bacterium]|nr:hypothetical protein [Cyclobacteriaceae bacterium]
MPESRNQVFELALKSLDPLIKEGLPEDLQHVVVATSCPDAIAPSLGQMIQECFHKQLSTCETIDLVQGCAGGV